MKYHVFLFSFHRRIESFACFLISFPINKTFTLIEMSVCSVLLCFSDSSLIFELRGFFPNQHLLLVSLGVPFNLVMGPSITSILLLLLRFVYIFQESLLNVARNMQIYTVFLFQLHEILTEKQAEINVEA